MNWKLCIAEKPSVARDIARVIGANQRRDGYFEGNGFLVTWAVGHLVGLAEPPIYGFVSQNEMYGDKKEEAFKELPLIPDDFRLVVLDSTKEQFRIVKNLMNRDDVSLVIDCGDMGPEGHILQWLIRELAGCCKPVKRFCTTSMTDEAISKAMANLRPIEEFENIIKGEFCKKKADWIMGMSLSRVESLKYNAGINVGRVQSPTLYFIVKRYLEVTNFKVTGYFTMDAKLKEGFHVFWKKDVDGKFPLSIKDSEGRVFDKNAIAEVARKIEQNGTGEITDITIKKRATDRPQLYDITELQRDANRRYGYTAAATLATAQALYETQKVLSYPRTDSRYITTDLEPYIEPIIKAIGTIDKYRPAVKALLAESLNIDKKIIDDKKVSDHHAIIPTGKIENFDLSRLIPTPEENKKGVTKDSLKNILDLVLSRMIISFSYPYFYEHTAIKVLFPNGFTFNANGTKALSMGWKAVQKILLKDNEEEVKSDEEMEQQIFPDLVKGQVVAVDNCIPVAKKTVPPKLHTEATLLTAMENAGAALENGSILKGKGIGTQATRADVIKKLFDTGVIEDDAKGKTKYLRPTQKGLSVIRVLPQELYSPKITADWETKIAEIAEGKSTEKEFMDDFVVFIKDKVQEVKDSQTNVSFKKEREVFGLCPWCGGDIYCYKKNEKGKEEYISYYCSSKCGFNLNTSDQTFIMFLGRKIRQTEALRFISKGSITLNVKKKSGDGTYKGIFMFKEYIGKNGVKYCNVRCESAKAIRK